MEKYRRLNRTGIWMKERHLANASPTLAEDMRSKREFGIGILVRNDGTRKVVT